MTPSPASNAPVAAFAPRCLLAASDLSAPARHALDRALRLAAGHGAALTVLHVLELGAAERIAELLGDSMAPLRAALETRARANLAAVLGDPRHHRGVQAELAIAAGPVAATIVGEAAACGADLLVLGARGADFLRHQLLGSTASRVLRTGRDRPVLVVKQPAHEDYRRLLLPVDFSPVSARSIACARQLAPGAELVLLHAVALPYEGKLEFAGVDAELIARYQRLAARDAEQRLQALAQAAGLGADDYRTRVVAGDAVPQVLAQEQENDSDLIVLGKHGSGLTEELLLGSVTKHILAESRCDVLVVG